MAIDSDFLGQRYLRQSLESQNPRKDQKIRCKVYYFYRKMKPVGKNVLDIEFDYDFLLTAIVSPVKDYHLCWHLNRSLGFEFSRKEDLEINMLKKRKLAYFSTYEYFDKLDHVHHVLISNRSAGEFLIPELNKVDFFLLQRENYHLLDHHDLIHQIKALSPVQTAFEVEPTSLASKQNLIF